MSIRNNPVFKICRHSVICSNLFAAFKLTRRGYLKDKGWFVSFRKQSPVDLQGEALPWLTYPLIAFLEEKLHSGIQVFEYGSGNSTLWLSKRVKQVVSCEHDPDWYNYLQARLPANVDYVFRPLEYGGDYAREIENYAHISDVVIIDGRDRINCAKNALARLKHDAVIIWDNTEREEYREGIDFLQGHGFKRINFYGIGPIHRNEWCTTLFYRSGNCLQV